MTNEYRELLAMVARNAAINGERAIELSEEKNEDVDKTEQMVQNFRDIEDRLNAGQELTSLDYVYLWAGASVSRTTIQKNIDKWTAVVHEYDISLIPKLFEIAKAPTDEEKQVLINKYFNENENLTDSEN